MCTFMCVYAYMCVCVCVCVQVVDVLYVHMYFIQSPSMFITVYAAFCTTFYIPTHCTCLVIRM